MKQSKVPFKLSVWRILQVFLLVTMLVFDVLIALQYASRMDRGAGGVAILVMVSILLWLTLCCVGFNTYLVKSDKVSYLLFAVSVFCLSAVAFLTGNDYVSILWVIMLTPVYIQSERMRDNFITGGISLGVGMIGYVFGWLFSHPMATDMEKASAILTGLSSYILILGLHFVVVNFITKYYRNNQKLRRALDDAQKSHEELDRAYRRLAETAVLEERNRIAKDIHDTAGHSMTAIIMQTEAAKMLIDTDPNEAKKRIISANMQAKTALDQMRESVHLLGGRATESTLKQIAEAIAAQSMDGTDIKVRCDVDELVVNDEYARVIGNCIKESIVNGIRHGSATAFYIEIKAREEKIDILLSDNGKGSASFEEGFGLTGMRKNIERLHGTMTVHTEEGEGFEITIMLPYSPKEATV